MTNKELEKLFFNELKNKIDEIQEKYKEYQDKVTDYYNELMDAFGIYAENSGDYDYESIMGEIVCGEDCLGVVAYPDVKKLYYFTEDDKVQTVDYKLLTELSNKTFKLLSNGILKDEEYELN